MKKEIKINYRGTTYTIDFDGTTCIMKEHPNLIFPVKSEDEIPKKTAALLHMWFKNEAVYGMKSLTCKLYKFEPFGKKLDITFMSFYASRYWVFYFNKSKAFQAFTLRLFGVNIYYSSKKFRIDI